MIKFGNTNLNAVGTVTNVAAGNLTPLFTTTVTNPTTAASITFARIAKAANLVYASPSSGAAGNPDFRALVWADLPAPIVKTVAQMQAIKALAEFIPGALYQISDAYGSRAAGIQVRAYDNDTLYAQGVGNFQGDNMSAPLVDNLMIYNLDTDTVTTLYNPVDDLTIDDTNGTILNDFQLESGVFLRSVFINCTGGGGNSIAKVWDCYFKGCFIDQNTDQYISVTATDYNFTHTGVGGSLIADGCTFIGGTLVFTSATLTDCTITQRSLDISAISPYSASGKTLTPYFSDFDVTRNPDGTNSIDLSDIQFVGIIRVSNGTNTLDNVNTFPGAAQDVIIKPDPGVTLTVDDTIAGGGNIYFPISATVAILSGNNADFITLRNGATPPALIVVEYYQRV